MHHTSCTTHHPPLTIHHSPSTTHHPPLITTRHPPLTIHHSSPPVIHHSPSTTHHNTLPVKLQDLCRWTLWYCVRGKVLVSKVSHKAYRAPCVCDTLHHLLLLHPNMCRMCSTTKLVSWLELVSASLHLPLCSSQFGASVSHLH